MEKVELELPQSPPPFTHFLVMVLTLQLSILFGLVILKILEWCNSEIKYNPFNYSRHYTKASERGLGVEALRL